MTSRQAALEQAARMSELGQTDSPNVEMVRMEGVRIIGSKVIAQVRKELNQGVKDGRLGHLKKDGAKPEVYFHPNSKGKAVDARNREALQSIEALKKICC
jgi:hypothetical protein